MIVRRALWCFVASVAFLGAGHGQQKEQPQAAKPKQAGQAKQSDEKKKPPRKRIVTDLSGFDLLEPDRLRKLTTVAGATRGLPPPVALAPRLGKLYGANPVFASSYAGKAQNFVFILRNAAQEEIFRNASAGATYRYPEDAPQLEPERTYFWAVEVSSIFGSAQSAPVGFIVMSANQRHEIEKKLAKIVGSDSYQAGLARARVFTESRLWYDALAAYSDLIVHYPDRADLYEERGMIYAQLDVTQKLAEKDFTRAEELRARR